MNGFTTSRFMIALIGAVVATTLIIGSTVALAGSRGASTTSSSSTGVVVVNTRLAFENGAAAGTGIAISPGEVLTNNHVIRSATSIRITDASGRTFSATVAGYSVSKDVALLVLRNAHGLKAASIGNSASVAIGDQVTAVGNTGGTGVLTTSNGQTDRTPPVDHRQRRAGQLQSADRPDRDQRPPGTRRFRRAAAQPRARGRRGRRHFRQLPFPAE